MASLGWEDGEKRRATITVSSGHNLPKKDMMGKCDPFVVLTWQGKERKTQVKKSTFDPVWEETMEVLDWVDAGTYASTGSLKVVVMDYDGLTSNDYVGESEIPASNLFQRQEEDFEVSYTFICV
jgi:Ca2+-dependent lipid-binding protein